MAMFAWLPDGACGQVSFTLRARAFCFFEVFPDVGTVNLAADFRLAQFVAWNGGDNAGWLFSTVRVPADVHLVAVSSG